MGRGLGLSVRARPGPGREARGAGAAMAAVFDLDLETEEGSEGEGDPEFSPAVSAPPHRYGLKPSLSSGRARASVLHSWSGLRLLHTWIFARSSGTEAQTRLLFQTPAAGSDSPFSTCDLCASTLALFLPFPIPEPNSVTWG